MKFFIVRQSSSSKLFSVVTDGTGPDDVYRQYAWDVLGRRDAWNKNFDLGNVDIDVAEVCMDVGAAALVFAGD